MGVNRAYALADVKLVVEAMMRKFGVLTLWAAAGRSSEAAYCGLDAMEWDPEFTCIFNEYKQFKTHKAKLIAMVAGANRHSCWCELP